MTQYQQRKVEDAAEPGIGLGRRATDTTLRGLQIVETDNDEAWQNWQDALKQQEQDGEPTQPAPLE